MNIKRGKLHPLVTVFLVLGIVAIGVLLITTVLPMLTAVPEGEVPVEERIAVTTQVLGDPASLKFSFNEIESGTNVRTAPPMYVWEKSTPTGERSIIAKALATSRTATTAVSSSIGKYIDFFAYNTTSTAGTFAGATYTLWGDPVLNYYVDEAIEYPKGVVHKCPLLVMNFKASEDGTIETTPSISVGASQTSDFDYFKIENNNTDSALRLGSIVADINLTSTNLIDFEIKDMVEKDAIPDRIRKGDYRFDLVEPVILSEFDTFETGRVLITSNATDGGGVAATFNQGIDIFLLDSIYHIGNADELREPDVEDNKETKEDIGCADMKAPVIEIE